MIVVDSIIRPAATIQTEFADTTNTVCELTEVTFTATAEDVGSNPTYQWLINGASAGGNAPVFTTNQLLDGDAVTLEVTSSLGCATGEIASSNSISINVIPPPEITCQADSFVSNQPTFFEVEVTNGGLAPFEYFWSFGDGSLGFGETVEHIYQDAGVYTATVDVYDSLGCSVSCQTFMTISPNLFADFSVDTVVGCAPFEVQFDNLSQNAVTNFWSFGDGNGSTQTSPLYTYSVPGTYDVALWIYAGNGNDSVAVFSQIVVNPKPVANFQSYELNAANGGDTVQFADNSLFADDWFWDFGDPASGAENNSTEQNPIHAFVTNGAYNVSLIVSNVYGCSDTLTLPSKVNVGVDDLSLDKPVRLFPNPASEWMELTLLSSSNESVEFLIVDVLGQTVRAEGLNLITGVNKKRIDITQLAEGSYVLSIRAEGSKHSLPFVVIER